MTRPGFYVETAVLDLWEQFSRSEYCNARASINWRIGG